MREDGCDCDFENFARAKKIFLQSFKVESYENVERIQNLLFSNRIGKYVGDGTQQNSGGRFQNPKWPKIVKFQNNFY